MNINRQSIRYLSILFCALALSGCLSIGGFNHKQVKVLKQQGFVYTDDGWVLDMPARLLFETDQFALSEANQQSIIQVSSKIHNVGINKLYIQGHTDNVGTEQYNQQLSFKRAESVADAVKKTGFQEKDIMIKGFGSTKPLKSNDTEEGRGENRRVSIIVIP